MKATVILVDDEKKALKNLRTKLNEFFPELQIVEEFQDPEKAIEGIHSMNPDMVFLDVSMPRINGLDVLKQLDTHKISVIFTTAFDAHAIEAINNHASGYVLKPIDNELFKKVVNENLEKISERKNHASQKAIPNSKTPKNLR